eukprot:7159693-Karenia_brevis.AAC.1
MDSEMIAPSGSSGSSGADAGNPRPGSQGPSVELGGRQKSISQSSGCMAYQHYEFQVVPSPKSICSIGHPSTLKFLW